MTQARNFPKSTTTLSEDNFIIDDGNTTLKNGIDKIKNIYHFLIGSCILLNETNKVVYHENELRKITYMKMDSRYKQSSEATSITASNNGVLLTSGFTICEINNGVITNPVNQGMRLNKDPISSGGLVFVRIISNDLNTNELTFDLNIPSPVENMQFYNIFISSNSILGRYVNINKNGQIVNVLGDPSGVETAIILNGDKNQYDEWSNITLEVQQNITLLDLNFGTLNYPEGGSDGFTISELENYPILKQRFSQHNITRIQKNIQTNTYFGFIEVFNNNSYQDEIHIHQLSYSGTTSFSITSTFNLVDSEGRIDALKSSNTTQSANINLIQNTPIDISVDFDLYENSQYIKSSNSDTENNLETKPNSYSTNLYIITKIEWL